MSRRGPAGPRTGGPAEPLPAAFYDRPVLEVALDLIGCTVRHGDTAGVIVETEAYHDSEAACHAHVGLTPRTHVLFGPPGVAYVYRSYGIHALLNAVCEPEGVGAAVLIRALEPVDGLPVMQLRRGPVKPAEVCNGPGKLTQALGIGLELNQSDLTGAGPVAVLPPDADPTRPAPEIATGTRIGITKAAELPWRFAVKGSRWTSRPRL